MATLRSRKPSVEPEYAPTISVEDPQAPVVCPAGEQIAGVSSGKRGCYCNIAHEFVDARRNGRSLLTFCHNLYQECPTWREAKRAEAERRHKHMADELDNERPKGPSREELR